jgi:CBS domain-containing protein
MDPLAIRRRLTVVRDGSTRTSALVFCERMEQSVPLARCATCPFGGAIRRDEAGRNATVDCCRVALAPASSAGQVSPRVGRPQEAGVASIAASLPVGMCLMRTVVCIANDTTLAVAARGLDMEPSAYGVAVVDAEERFVGILPRARAALAVLQSRGEAATAHVASERCTVDERQSIGVAFATMTARHRRELIVTGDGGTLVGVVRDLDALRFVSHVARTGCRP